MSLFGQLFTIFEHTEVLTRNEDKNTGRLYGEVRSMLTEERELFDRICAAYCSPITSGMSSQKAARGKIQIAGLNLQPQLKPISNIFPSARA